MWKFSIPHREKHTEMITQVGILEQNSANVGLSQFVMVSCVTSEWCEEKSC